MNKMFCTGFLAVMAFTVNAQTSCASAANIYTFSFNGSNYEVVKEAKTWTAAAACAVQRGGSLVEINDQAEQTAVYNAIVASGISANYSPVVDGGGASYVWLGATDNFNEGVWKWDGNNDNNGGNFWNGQGLAGAGNGTAVAGAFVNWGGKSNASIQEPDDFFLNQDGAAMAVSSWPYGIAGEWNDIALTNSIYFVVEYSNTTGLKANQQLTSLQIFPNPTKEKIEVTSTVETKKLEVRSVDGKIVRTVNTVKKIEIIDLTGLTSGIYFVDVTTKDNSVITKKIVKE
jgi:hypothetical protein